AEAIPQLEALDASIDISCVAGIGMLSSGIERALALQQGRELREQEGEVVVLDVRVELQQPGMQKARVVRRGGEDHGFEGLFGVRQAGQDRRDQYAGADAGLAQPAQALESL